MAAKAKTQTFLESAKQQRMEDRVGALLRDATALVRRDRGVSEEVLQFFIALKKEPDVCAEVLHELRQFHAVTAAEIRKQIGLGESITSGNIRVARLPEHYTACDVRTGVTFPITNFSLSITYGVWFEQEKETWFRGTIYLADTEYPVLIPSAYLDKPAALLATCKSAIYRSSTGHEIQQPIILRSEYSRQLMLLIQAQTQGARLWPGADTLGWQRSSAHFIAPGWQVRENQVVSSVVQPHPKNEFFRNHYAFARFTPLSPPAGAWPAQTFIAVVVALLRRAHCRNFVPPISVQHNAAMESLLCAIFRPLGQTAPMVPATRKLEKYLSGYPVLAIGEKSPPGATGFLLTKDGLNLGEDVVVDEAAVSALSAQVLGKCLVAIAAEIPAPMIPCANFFDLATEGKQIIEQYFGPWRVEPAKFKKLWHYLSEIPLTKLASYATLDINEQQLYLLFNGHKTKRGEVKSELEKELPEAGVQGYGDRRLKLAAIPGLNLLREFYGPDVKIPNRSTRENLEVSAGSESVNSSRSNT